jgi:hypothetical protein
MANVEPSSFPSRAGYAIRASLACIPCRNRHRKCDAQRPICSQCQGDNGECFYKKSRRGRPYPDIWVEEMEETNVRKGAIRTNRPVLKDTNVDSIPVLSAGWSSVSPAASGASKSFDWLGTPDMLANGDIEMSNRDPKTDLQNAAIHQLDESSIFELPHTWQATSFPETQEFRSINTTYPIGSKSRKRKEGLIRVNDSTSQRRPNMFNINHSQNQSYLGGSFPFLLNQIPVPPPPFRDDLVLSNNGTSEMPMIVYGYGSWTATASNGSIKSISLGYGSQEARGVGKQKHIPTFRDEAFPSVGYFYRPPASQEDAHWLLPLLKRSAPLYHACVSLGLCHQLLGMENPRECQIVFSNELRRHHASSLKGLQQQIDSLPTPLDAGFITTALELLACIWQLLSIEVCLSRPFNPQGSSIFLTQHS